MSNEPMALLLFSKSVMKQAKLRNIEALLPPTEGRTCLDIGGDNGVISHFLRRRGGLWHSADLTAEAVESIRSLVGSHCHLFDGGRTSFPDKAFDCIVVIDFLEHIAGDRAFVEELHRLLADDGTLVVNVPHRKSWSLIRPLRLALGLTDEKHGHLRPGYSRGELAALLAGRFEITAERTYSRFFAELIDAALSFVYATVGKGKGKKSAKGVLLTGKEVKSGGGMFKAFAALYPVIWLVTRLDLLLFFTRGYCLAVRARKVVA